MWRIPLSCWPEQSDLDSFSTPSNLPLSSRKSPFVWPGEAERLGGGQAEPPGGHRHPWVCSWRTLQTSAMPPVHWVLLVCPGWHGTPPAWYFHSVRAIARPGEVPGWRRWDIKKYCCNMKSVPHSRAVSSTQPSPEQAMLYVMFPVECYYAAPSL